MRLPSVLTALALTLSSAALAQQPPASLPGADFPDGPGKALVQRTCNGCHDISRLKIGYTPEGWHTVVRMMQNMGAPLGSDDWLTVTDYLVKAFPERTRPAAKLIPGPVQVEFKMFDVPTPGSRPHDPLATHDGMIWWTGQLAGVLGRLDPKTGETKEFALKIPHSGPHGLTEDKDGRIWFTANNVGAIGNLDPKTGLSTYYRIPDSKARDPHTLLFGSDGFLWFTVQQGNKIGRLDPKTGAMKLVSPPTENARPYGMALDSKGVMYIVEFGANKIMTIGGADMAIKEFTLPDAGARPRRIAIGPDDTVWYADFARGFLGHLDPKTGAVKEFPSPSGAASQPYGMVFTKGAIYYDESNAKPNAIVRFDPASETFQSWAVPGALGGDIVRNMVVGLDGNPVMSNSLQNTVGIVTIK